MGLVVGGLKVSPLPVSTQSIWIKIPSIFTIYSEAEASYPSSPGLLSGSKAGPPLHSVAPCAASGSLINCDPVTKVPCDDVVEVATA